MTILYRAVTGVGGENRKLYTDNDSIIVKYRRAVIINGIGIPSTRPDFLDRCLTVECKRFSHFKSQERLAEDYERQIPDMLGGFCDLLVKVLSLIKEIPVPAEFRLADFAQLGHAVAQALGKETEEFDLAYRYMIHEQARDVVEDCMVARFIQQLAQTHPQGLPWEGTSTELLRELTSIARSQGLSNHKNGLPGSPRWLSTRVGELIPALKDGGILVEQLPRTRESRKWRIEKR